MTNLEDIQARWAEYNTRSHQVDWYIDRGLALAGDMGALLEMIARQQAVIDAAKAYMSAEPGSMDEYDAVVNLRAALAALNAHP